MTMPQSQPNILLIMADQLVAALTGPYGHTVVQTSNLDALAAGGVRFDAAYSSCPLCAPARASLITGRYVSNCKVWDNAAPLGSDVPTVAHYLTLAGYDAVCSGKMHYVGPDQLHGLRARLTTDVYPASMAWLPDARRAPAERVLDRRQHARSYSAAGTRVASHSMFLAHDDEVEFRAIEYLRQQGMAREQYAAKTDGAAPKPFFLMASFHCPHDPHTVTQELWDLYEGAEIDLPHYPADMEATYSAMDRWLNAYHGTDRIDIKAPESIRAFRRAYYGLVTSIDRRVGRLMQALREAGLDQETIIVFTADHGDMLADKNMVQKRSFYDWSCRVPLIVRWPDGAHAGGSVPEAVSLMDLAPTILDWAAVPAESRRPMDGRSLLPTLVPGSEPERVALAESHTNGVYAPCFMARQGDWKYVHIHGEQGQLFNLADDPGEWRNRVDDPTCAETVARLKGLILARFDPEAIEAELCASLRDRAVVQPATVAAGTHWDHAPYFDANKQYVR
jgi:choline-sulfatase